MKRYATIAALAVFGLTFLGLGIRSLTSAPSAETEAMPTLSTDVLSPRRLPDTMANAASDQGARTAIAAAMGPAGLDATRASLAVAREGRDVIERSEATARIPASLMKLITAAAALEVLGEDTRFTTSVKASASIDNGTVKGPLYLVGGGDPLLFSDEYATFADGAADHASKLSALADEVVKAGVKRVNGSVLGDDTLFDKQRAVPTWSPSYAVQGEVGPVGALTVDQGFASFVAGKVGASDPAQSAAAKLTELLRARGITVNDGAATGNAPDKAKTVASLESSPVRDLVSQLLTYSDNTTSEIMLKNMGVKFKNEGTTAAGAEAVRDFLQDQGLDASSYAARDGSGLDRGDKLSCNLLQAIMQRGNTSILRDGLPKAGQTGTLRDRMIGTPAVGRVQAKTGSLHEVSALAGWANPNDNQTFTFCMITNGISTDTARQLEDRLAVTLASMAPAPKAEQFAP